MRVWRRNKPKLYKPEGDSRKYRLVGAIIPHQFDDDGNPRVDRDSKVWVELKGRRVEKDEVVYMTENELGVLNRVGMVFDAE